MTVATFHVATLMVLVAQQAVRVLADEQLSGLEGRINALEKNNALDKNIATARGEASAAHLLASAAIQAALAIISNREEVFARMSTFIDETLNMSGPGRGDAHDELNTLMRETTRFQAMQSLDASARTFRNPPARG